MIDYNSIPKLNEELEKVMINFAGFHGKMKQSADYYKHSAFYPIQAGQDARKNQFAENYLKVFADKNIEYTCELPLIKVPTGGVDPNSRKAASVREKILHATHRRSRTKLLTKKWAQDATIKSVAIAETYPDLKNRCMKVKRYRPDRVFWQTSNDNDNKVIAFWAVYTITLDEAKSVYGVTPKKDLLSNSHRAKFLSSIDGKDHFTYAIRWDGQVRVAWIGDVFAEKPHKHALGEIPIDICAPLDSTDEDEMFPAFYLDPLVPLQAELNDVYYRRSRITRRMSSPVAWIRGVPAGRKLEDIKAEMAKPGGGLIGLSQNGEAGLLQIAETRMLNDHEDRITLAMTRLSGYGNAAFGESVGANTSGDALGMYFNATQRKIEHQNIAWIAFFESINAKIFRGYEKMLKTNEVLHVDGWAPGSTVTTTTDEAGNTSYRAVSGGYSESFDKRVIDGKYDSVVIPASATPKNELEHKRLAIQAVQQKFMSRTTAYELFGILSPEDELALVEQEQQSPALNPQGMQQIMGAMQSASSAGLTEQPGVAANVGIDQSAS